MTTSQSNTNSFVGSVSDGSVSTTATKPTRRIRRNAKAIGLANVATTIERGVHMKVNFQVRSIMLQNVLDNWARTGGVISRRDAVAYYKHKMWDLNRTGFPMQNDKVVEFIVQRFLQTRGKRLSRGVYQIVTKSHSNLGIFTESIQNKKGVMIPNLNAHKGTEC